jgi:hypothetical protein
MLVTARPGASGVNLDYAVFNPAAPDHLRRHIAPTVIERTHDGGAVMVIGHMCTGSPAILKETERGVFELAGEGSPFPLKIVVAMPEAGWLRHAWWDGSSRTRKSSSATFRTSRARTDLSRPRELRSRL